MPAMPGVPGAMAVPGAPPGVAPGQVPIVTEEDDDDESPPPGRPNAPAPRRPNAGRV